MKALKRIFIVTLSALCVIRSLPILLFLPAGAEEIELKREKINIDKKRIMVSLGDSFSSGEGIEDFYGQENIVDKIVNINSRKQRKAYKSDCLDWLAHRSENSWPGRLEMLGVKGTMSEHRNDNWYFAAVSGATTYDLEGRQEKEYDLNKRYINEHNINLKKEKKSENKSDKFKEYEKIKDKLSGKYDLPAQLDIFEKIKKKGETVDYVTLTIGGNDMHFTDILKAGIRVPFSLPVLMVKFDLIWSEFYYGIPSGKRDINPSIKSRLYKAYKDIQEKAGSQAKIIVAGYPELLSVRDHLLYSRQCCELINKNVVKFNKEIEKIVKDCRENKNMNIYFVSVDEEEYFKDHGAYSLDPYLNRIYLSSNKEDIMPGVSAYSMHPNEKGADAYARAVQKKIDELEGIEACRIVIKNYNLYSDFINMLATKCECCFIDIDFDGDLEFMLSRIGGTGFFSNVRIYDVDLEKEKLILLGETDPEKSCIDDACNGMKLYSDKRGNTFYVGCDTVRNGMWGFSKTFYRFGFDGEIILEMLRGYSEENDADMKNTTKRFYNKDGNEISESEYNRLEKEFESDNTDLNLKCKAVESFNELSDEDKLVGLVESYITFSYDTPR